MTNGENKAAESIMDAAKTVYLEEQDRFKTIETKTGLLLAFAGTGLTIFGGFFKPDGQDLFNTILFTIIVFSLVYSILMFFVSLKIDTYEQIDLNNLVQFSFAEKGDYQAMLEIAATYEDSINKNKLILEKKIKSFNKGLLFLIIALTLIGIYFVLTFLYPFH
jgi:hypothetical protein